MILLNIYSFLLIIITITIIITPLLLRIIIKKWSEKYSTFECGINTESTSRKPFSLRFFLLIILFIIFDIEITLILVIPILTYWSTQIALFITIFIIILSTGTIYEWAEGSINWKT